MYILASDLFLKRQKKYTYNIKLESKDTEQKNQLEYIYF